MRSLQISIGERFGRWVVVGPFKREKRGEGRGANYPVLYPCRCDCGHMRDVRAFKLLSNSRSCGCLKVEKARLAKTSHGHTTHSGRTSLYSTWSGMLQRCSNPNNSGFARYGGRGVTVDASWRTFNTFREWALSSGYADGLQIDRIDNDGSYTPTNCRWVDEATNKRNTSQTHHVTAFGETKCLTDWAYDRRCRVSVNALYHRLAKLKMSPEVAITTPHMRSRA